MVCVQCKGLFHVLSENGFESGFKPYELGSIFGSATQKCDGNDREEEIVRYMFSRIPGRFRGKAEVFKT